MSDQIEAGARARPWLTETVGWLVAIAASLVAATWVASTSDALVYSDGDSVIVAMLARSVALGQPQEWALSPVLFVPEAALYGALSLLGLGVRATLTVNAVVNFVLLYGAIRLVAGRRVAGRAPVAGAVGAFLVFVLLVLLEGRVALAGLQLATLLATTTYYSATVVASIAVIGLARRALEGAHPTRVSVVVAVVAAVSTMTNPLFAVWAVAPAILVLAVLVLGQRLQRARVLIVGGALGVGAIGGYLARIPFSRSIVATDGNYVRLDRWMLARDHFATALFETFATWHGMLWTLLVLCLFAACVVIAVRAWRRGDGERVFVAGVAVVSPLATTVGAIAIGTDADRYLQPWVFLPVLAVALASPRVPSIRVPALTGVAVATVVAAVATPVLVSAAVRDDADLDCVVTWVDGSGRTGAGQFWSVRAPKAYLSDPTRLVQVDHTLRVYEWLTNRVDTAAGDVAFLVQTARDYPFALPAGVALDDARQVSCGRYTIYDFGDLDLRLGSPHN